MANNWWSDFWSFNWLPHPGYDSTADAAKAFFMPSAYSSEKNVAMQRETNEANRQLVEYQNQQNIEQWNRENAYNDPSNVMQRLRGAGLNPALMYGQGAGQLSSAPSPTMQASRDEAATIQQDDILSKMFTLAQVRNIDADTKSKERETARQDDLHTDNLVKLKSENEKIRHEISSMDLQQQRDALAYLHDSLRYSLDNSTFNDAIMNLKEGLRGTRLENKIKESDLNRAAQLLPLELLGFDLSNRKLRSAIDLEGQQYRLIQDTWDDLKSLRSEEVKDKTAQRTLKELQFYIDAVDNPRAFDMYKGDLNGEEPVLSEYLRWTEDVSRFPGLRTIKNALKRTKKLTHSK